jgi:ATP-dependent DNA helicase PIF1
MAKPKIDLLLEITRWPEWQGLTALQKDFFVKFFHKENIFLTGPAGTGKSYTVNLLFKFLDSKGMFYGKTATTGVAALNIGGTTVHSWSGMGLADEHGMDLLNKVKDNVKARKRIESSKVLVIDEVSMAKGELIEKLDIVCQYIRDSDKPFGGIQVVFVGDFMQLPPVFSHNEEERFAFESQAWLTSKITTIHLTEIVRQHDEPHFAKFLNDVRMGAVSDLSVLSECVGRKFPDDGIKPVKLFCKNIDVNSHNEKELAKIASAERTYGANDEGADSWKLFFDKNCPAPTHLRLKKGAQVILLVNKDVEMGLVNGSVGIVQNLYDSSVEVKFACGTVLVEYNNWEVKQNEFDTLTGTMKKVVLAKRRQIPLKLAWALTIHKAQGSTLDRAEIDIGEAFAAGQVYVALSRVRNLKSLSVKSFSSNKITVNKKCLNFYKEQASVKPTESEFFNTHDDT